MRRLLVVCFVLMLGFSCVSSTRQLADDESSSQPYYQQIREWQQRIQKEGWAETQVHHILNACIQFVEYDVEIDDHWDTPREFIQKGFRGDCEDIVIFLMGTLRRLKYPYGVKIVAVTGLFENHALLKVEMPDGTWRYFDTAAGNPPHAFHIGYKPVVEFDETDISYYRPRP